MLLENYPIQKMMVGHFFHFGLEAHKDVAFGDFCDRCPFHNFAAGCFHAGSDSIRSCERHKDGKVLDPSLQVKSSYLTMYQKNIHRRIRPLFRQLRDALVIELKALPISQVLISDKAYLGFQQPPVLRGLVVLQKIGVGFVSLWVENLQPQQEEQWCQVRDPRLITLNIDTPEISRTKWPLFAFVRYLILLSHLSLSRKEVLPVQLESDGCLDGDRELDNFLGRTLSEFSGKGPFVSVEIDNYPFFFIQYGLSTVELRKKFNERPEDLRLALCGDTNWRYKSSQIVKETVISTDVSTRDSILWLVNPEGTVKIASAELQTPVEESITATLIETDIILTMRYFLQRTNSLIVNFSGSELSPSELTTLRHGLFSNLDKYGNIEVSHKDTTRQRLEKFKSIFRISSLYQGVVDRFDLLHSRLSTQDSVRIERQQVLLTIVFGFFAALNVFYRIFPEIPYIKDYGWSMHCFLSFDGALVVALALLVIARLLRRGVRH